MEEDTDVTRICSYRLVRSFHLNCVIGKSSYHSHDVKSRKEAPIVRIRALKFQPPKRVVCLIPYCDTASSICGDDNSSSQNVHHTLQKFCSPHSSASYGFYKLQASRSRRSKLHTRQSHLARPPMSGIAFQ